MERVATGLCDDPVWDWDMSWDTDRPRLSRCFRGLVLTILPCCLLWLTTLLDAVLSRCKVRHHHKCGPFPWTLVALCKQALTWTLIVCAASEGARHLSLLLQNRSSSPVDQLSVCVRLITYMLALYQQVRQRRRGRLSSAKLCLYWTISAPCQLLASPLYELFTGELDERSDPALFVLGTLSLSLVMGEAFLSHFTDPQYDAIFTDPKTLPWMINVIPYYASVISNTMNRSNDEYLIDHQSPLSRLSFSWIGRLMRRGHKNVLCPEDTDVLRPDVRTNHICGQFLGSWNKEKTKSRPSLVLALFRVMWPWLLVAVTLDVIADFAILAPPIILDWMISFVQSEEEPRWHGPVYALMLFGAAVLTNLLVVHNQDFIIRSFTVPKFGLSATLYKKVFRLSLGSRRGYSLGELCNLVTVDVQRIFELGWSANTLWSSPLSMGLTLALLWNYLGPACLAGAGVLVALMPISAVIAARAHRIQKSQMEWKDSRLRLMNEILNGIKVLKLFAWELPFVRRVGEVRESETRALKKLALLNGTVIFLWILAPFLVALCSFVTFVLWDERNILDPSTAFVSLTLFSRLRNSISSIPEVLIEVVQSRVSFRRVTDFLMCEEQEPMDERQLEMPSSGRVVELQGASFSWGGDGDPFLRDVTFSLRRGDLVAVVGRVGAGKSALLAALLGEMTLKEGTVKRQQGVRSAYVSQTAWIQNASLRQNVLFVSPMDRRRYDSVIRGCCLKPDLKTLPAGDHTEIGEKGVNLSGGQRQRVSLSRAVYHDADLYLLDDPLSAVDAHVSRDIFQDVIGPKGMLAQKTRLLVTHDLSVLPQCDVVLLMSRGRIVESGSYAELLQKEDGELKRLVEEFAEERGAQQEDEGEELDEPSPDPSKLTTEELKAQMRRIGNRLSRTMSVESDQLRATAARFIEAERVELGRVRAGVYCSYFKSAGMVMMSLVFLGFAAHQAFEIGSNVWLSEWSSDGLLPDGSQDIPLRNLRMEIYGTLGLAQGICILSGSVLLALAATRASVRLHRSMLWSVIRSPLLFFETTPIGRILNRFGKDINGVDVSIPTGFSNVVTVIASLAGTMAVICANHPIFLIICVPILLLYIYVQLFYMSTSRQLRRMHSTTLSPVLSFFSECVQGASTIRAFGSQESFTKRQFSLMDTNGRVFLAQTRVNRWLGVRLQLMGAFVVLIVALLSVFQKEMYSAAIVGLTLSYALNVTGLLGQMVRLLTQLETRMVSVERVDEYSTLQEEASWSTEHCHVSLSGWPSEGSVSFRGYKMRYRTDSELVLKGIDLEIPGGQKVGVVGRTGAGKSSLAQALFRVVEPCDGRLFIDGVDVAALGLHDLRARITVIPQEPVLFGGDLRLNLDPEGRHSDAELLDALHLAGLDTSQSLMLDTELEEGGGNLSLGQRQQVCLSRALLRRSRVLVLDEATAAVDLETDRVIQEAVRREFRECTVLTVAHRLHTVIDCDRILVMDRGRIVEDGPPDELLKRHNSHFRELARAAGLL